MGEERAGRALRALDFMVREVPVTGFTIVEGTATLDRDLRRAATSEKLRLLGM